jgi:hypothetical protein
VAGCGSHATYFCWYGHRIHRDHECIPVDLDDLDFTTLTLKPSAGQWVRERLGLPSPPPAAVTQGNEPFPPRSRRLFARARWRCVSAWPPSPRKRPPRPPPRSLPRRRRIADDLPNGRLSQRARAGVRKICLVPNPRAS